MTKWLVSMMMLYMIGGVLCLGLLEATWYGGGTVYTVAETWKGVATASNPISGMVALITGIPTFVKALWDILSWNYPYLLGPGMTLARMVLLCITGGFIGAAVWSIFARSSPT